VRFSAGNTVALLLAIGIVSPGRAADESLPARVQFNRDIRPILSDTCFACHGPDVHNRKTKMRLDTYEGVLAGLPKGRYPVVPGEPEESEIIRRVTSDNKAMRMPPAYAGKDPLTPHEIALLRRWIEQGAQWEGHWSFLPPVRPELPEVHPANWERNPIDRFVWHQLEREGLKPSPEADRLTLLRRVTLDLTGLPPTPAEVEAYLKDDSPDVYEKTVDRLLASPRHAERMAIRWLDAARYSDTHGYQTDGVRSMWRWRDWVIDAYRINMPFDQFTIEQIAGDLLPNAMLAQRIATGFNRNHRTSGEGGIVDEEFRVEYVADRAETTGTVWLGLTVGCARCHDHKFDPITQKDFYSLFAFFNNVPEKGLVYNFGNEEPYVKAPTPEQSARLAELDHSLESARRKWDGLQPSIAKGELKWAKSLRRKRPLDWSVSEGLVVHHPLDSAASLRPSGCDTGDGCELPFDAGRHGGAARFDGTRYAVLGDVAKFDYLDPFTLAAWIRPEADTGAIVTRTDDYWEGEGYGLYLKDGKLRLHIIKRWTDIGLRIETEDALPLNEWRHVLVTYDGYRKSDGVHMYVNGVKQNLKVLFDDLNYPLSSKEPLKVGAGGGPESRFHGLIDDVRVYYRALTAEEAGAVAEPEIVSAIAAIPPTQRTPAQVAKLHLAYLDRGAPKKVKKARLALHDVSEQRRKYYDGIQTVMVMQDTAVSRPAYILKRGAYDAHGERVTAAVPAALPPMKPEWPANRLGLAKWLVDRSNPLTARVTVNRYWQMLFGIGLVKTAEDFGAQGDRPVYPDLLDWLAVEFMDSGWNVRSILKTIVMSATYRQASIVTPDLLQRDPENRLLARGPRFRLPAEMIRDQALAASGLLVERLGGPSVRPYQPPGLWKELSGGDYEAGHGAELYRRSLYTYWRRTIAPPNMVTFDAPNRETCTVRAVRTNTPLQALNLMNDTIYLEASRKIAERMIREGGRTAANRLAYGWELVLARPPRPKESAVLNRWFGKISAHYEADSKAAGEYLKEGESPIGRKLDLRELAAYTAVASLILNLDEAVTKE